MYSVIYRRGSGHDAEHNFFRALPGAFKYIVERMQLETEGRIYLNIEHDNNEREPMFMIWHIDGEWRIS